MYKNNQVVEVKVVSIVSYGAFCELSDGGTGLIHISEISDFFVPKITDHMKIGDKFEVEIIEFNQEKNQARLSYKSIRPELLKTNQQNEEEQKAAL